jgi:hypothetical protein
MPSRYDASAPRQIEFREVFRNCYVTGFSMRALVWTVCNVIFGLIFSVILLLYVSFFVLALSYVLFGLDLYPPLDMPNTIAGAHPSLGGLIRDIVIYIIGLLVLVTFALHNLHVVKQRLLDRLYLCAGQPLASVEGKPIFEPDSESGYNGIEGGEFYFAFDNCWLDVDSKELEKLARADGSMRIWYIPTGIRSWNPRTGKTVQYNCTLVRAEWRSFRQTSTL